MSQLIVLVEDNEADAELAIRAFKKHKSNQKIIHLEDGQEALEYLFDEQNEMPRLILLDVKMPRVDGLTVLQKLKEHPRKRAIPVVMLTSSREDNDIARSYELGVNAYIIKPVDFNEFLKAVVQIDLFWMHLNEVTAK